MSKERDEKFWENVEKYEKLVQLRRELHTEIDEMKRKLFKGLTEGARFDRNKRVQIVGSQSTTFSITKLRDKFGDEWIEENGDPSSSSTIQVKYMRKDGPKSKQYWTLDGQSRKDAALQSCWQANRAEVYKHPQSAQEKASSLLQATSLAAPSKWKNPSHCQEKQQGNWRVI